MDKQYTDMRQERADRAEQLAQDAYDEAFERIEAMLVEEAIQDGAEPDYKPSGAEVHRLVENEMKARKQ